MLGKLHFSPLKYIGGLADRIRAAIEINQTLGRTYSRIEQSIVASFAEENIQQRNESLYLSSIVNFGPDKVTQEA